MNRTISAVMLLTVMSATWAAGKWYLLLPPLSDFDLNAPPLSRYRILDDKPLSQWRRMGAFDSASDCQAAKTDGLDRSQQRFDASYSSFREYANRKDANMQRIDKTWQLEMNHAYLLMYTAARCVQSDDPLIGSPKEPAK